MKSIDGSKLVANDEVAAFIEKQAVKLRELLPEGSFAQREEAVLTIGTEIQRRALEVELQAIADRFEREIVVDGQVFREHEAGAVAYHSLVGDLNVQRSSFRQAGVHNGPTVIPMELVVGMVHRATPALAFNIAHEYAERDMRAHEQSLLLAHRVPPSRTTLERISKLIAADVQQAVPSIEPLLRKQERREELPDEACAVVMGLDRTAVAMLEDHPSDAEPKPPPRRSKPRLRKAPPPRDINWRMAYVGTVSLVDAAGEAVLVCRYASPACDDPRDVVARMCEDARSFLQRDPSLALGIVQDAAPEMWHRVREGCQELVDDGVAETWHEGIDRYHLLEHLATALELIEPDEAVRKKQLHDWNTALEESDAAIDEIQHWLCTRYAELPKAKQSKLWEELTYLRNNKDRMRYVNLRQHGLPVGSGVTEGAAKTLVGKRTKGAGRRWLVEPLRGVLTLRALLQSERLASFWTRLSRRYTARVDAA